MNDGQTNGSLRETLTPEEWERRVDLAALFRISAQFGWDDHLFTHSSARVPGGENHFLINPMSRCYEEITASDLQKFDEKGELVLPHPERAHGFAITIHLELYKAIPEAGCFIHLHSKASSAVSMQKEGLLPISQFALMVGTVGYHDYEGLVPKTGGFERMAASFDGCQALIMRNHGIITWGHSVGKAFLTTYNLEKACEFQIAATSGNAEINPIPQAMAETTRKESAAIHGGDDGRLPRTSWEAVIRKLDRIDPAYRS